MKWCIVLMMASHARAQERTAPATAEPSANRAGTPAARAVDTTFSMTYGFGASTADDLDFVHAASVSVGYAPLGNVFLTAELRHTATFVDSLVYDLFVDWIDAPECILCTEVTRTHETMGSVGAAILLDRFWIGASVGGALRYQVGDTPYVNTGEWLARTEIRYHYSDVRESEGVIVGVYAGASFVLGARGFAHATAGLVGTFSY